LQDEENDPSHITISSEHREAAWIRVNDLQGMEDVPDIYKTSILNWKRELEIRPRERHQPA
jgi:hypothetical protein